MFTPCYSNNYCCRIAVEKYSTVLAEIDVGIEYIKCDTFLILEHLIWPSSLARARDVIVIFEFNYFSNQFIFEI